ncbi:MFS transporter [Streptomyces avicenniae]|uniref:MFS transporter n=1 Tax=Streptomyces avicenniae TaxID=500153 RepID=UPI000AE760EB|nr:MFS transporter [Streptomyces avicenniae]
MNKRRSAPTRRAPRAAAPPGAPSAAAEDVLRRLRIALTGFFALDGFLFAGWVVRIPDVKEQTGASASALGLALLGTSAGAVVTMTLTGRLCQRFGSRVVTVVGLVLLALTVALPPHTHSAVVLGAVLLVFGAAFGAVNVAANSVAVDLVTATRQPIMPGFHAAYSLGGMIGAGLGGLVAGQLTAARHLGLLAAVGVVVALVMGRALIAGTLPVVGGGAGGTAGAAEGSGRAVATMAAGTPVRRLVIVLGFIALCSAYGEGALADWSALHLKESLDASAGVAAAAYSVFAGAMTVGRLTGSAMLRRLGQSTSLVLGGTTAAAGMLLGALAPTVWLALAGFVLTGLGLANIFPIALGQAGAVAGPRGVAAASTLGYGGMLLGPVAIGFLADWSSMPAALTTVAALAGVSAVIAHLTRDAVRPVG